MSYPRGRQKSEGRYIFNLTKTERLKGVIVRQSTSEREARVKRGRRRGWDVRTTVKLLSKQTRPVPSTTREVALSGYDALQLYAKQQTALIFSYRSHQTANKQYGIDK